MKAFVVLSVLFAAATAAPAPHHVVAPLYTAYAAPVAYAPQVIVPAVKTVHYADTPVVTGYTSQIYKPTLNAVPAVVSNDGDKLVYRYAAPFAVAPTADLRAPVPAGDAPAPEELVQTQKVYAPVRASQKITPEFDVHLVPQLKVNKVPVDVEVPAPYAHPVPVPVPVQPAVHFATPVVAVHKN